jgi:hypothetical protein
MSLFDFATGVKFRKTGKEVRTAIGGRVAELRRRLEGRNRELEAVMGNKPLLRSYLVREEQNDFPQPSQMKADLPSEEHQRITELCRRIKSIEKEIRELSVVRDNLAEDQELELSFEDITKLGFSPEHYE